ncbi:hypothetical protein DENSPDRAFT_550872 [Dentipellis sp. KUC8613]|nr:hypothetical protein DENSPDRAFT_550872 [Dentipellis sp. KUC8613]
MITSTSDAPFPDPSSPALCLLLLSTHRRSTPATHPSSVVSPPVQPPSPDLPLSRCAVLIRAPASHHSLHSHSLFLVLSPILPCQACPFWPSPRLSSTPITCSP